MPETQFSPTKTQAQSLATKATTVLLVKPWQARNSDLSSIHGKNGLFLLHLQLLESIPDGVNRLKPDVVLLDCVDPCFSITDICRELRKNLHEMPIIVLARTYDEAEHITVLESGASDYCVRPVAHNVLSARIKALAKLSATNHVARTSSNVLAFGDLQIHKWNRWKRAVTLRDLSIDLNQAEFNLLWLLASHAGRVVSRTHAVEALIGDPDNANFRTVDNRVLRLRIQLGDFDRTKIRSVRGKGYLFESMPW